MNSRFTRVLQQQIRLLKSNPHVTLYVNSTKMSSWYLKIHSLEYDSGIYWYDVTVPEDFPRNPPIVKPINYVAEPICFAEVSITSMLDVLQKIIGDIDTNIRIIDGDIDLSNFSLV